MLGFSENFCQHLKLLLSLEERCFYGLKATWIIGSEKFGTISHLMMERETSLQQQPKKATILIGKRVNYTIWLWYKCSVHPYLVGDVQFWSPHFLQSTVALQKGQRNGLPSKKKLK